MAVGVPPREAVIKRNSVEGPIKSDSPLQGHRQPSRLLNDP